MNEGKSKPLWEIILCASASWPVPSPGVRLDYFGRVGSRSLRRMTLEEPFFAAGNVNWHTNWEQSRHL
jgi:hypothetical protein